jgi:hypothetical protein
VHLRSDPRLPMITAVVSGNCQHTKVLRFVSTETSEHGMCKSERHQTAKRNVSSTPLGNKALGGIARIL